MKDLYLVRHAKSSWDYPELDDFERPLGSRGKLDAPFMAEIIREKGIVPDHLVSSSARRAQDTASYFAKAFERSTWEITLIDQIYEAFPDDLQSVVLNLNDDWNTVFLFGHNPGFTVFANRFTEGFRFDNVPTCGIVHIHGAVDFWQGFKPGLAKVEAWYFPKEFRI
ncbi:MAG: histidine phosphatase family protein [Saprospiraceae bacterium]|nr:histidine phosphatase family protein [Saprospiraceae bacterium]